MDSTTLAYLLKHEGYDLHILSFDYGQRHAKELEYAAWHAAVLEATWNKVDLTNITHLLSGSALTDDVPVPHGHYTEETMKATVVPNRNAIMLTIAYGAAVARGATCIATAVHAGDHAIYPDCRPAFIDAFAAMQAVAMEGFLRPDAQLYAPFVDIGKHDIVRIGQNLQVSYEDTWSCYEGGDLHCGKCGTCVERKEAFELAGVPDPTTYQD